MFSAPAAVGGDSSGPVSKVVSKVGNAGIAAFQPLGGGRSILWRAAGSGGDQAPGP